MKNKEKFLGFLLLILFAVLPYSLMRISIFLQKSIFLINHKDLILQTTTSRGILMIELLSVIPLIIILIATIDNKYISKKSNKNYKQKYNYKSSNKLLKGYIIVTLFVFLICGRYFTIITPDKIYYSSFDTLFLTKSYDYSEVKTIDIESRKGTKGRYILEYNISFERHNVDLMGCIDNDKELKINKVHRNIIKNSKNIIMTEYLAYKTDEIMDEVNILTDLS